MLGGRVSVIVAWLALFVGFVLMMSGCGGVALGEDGARWCAAACGVGGVERCERHAVTCREAPGVCSLDRLLVTPVPPGPDGRERRGGRLAAAGVAR